jgi:hypothetical protein
LLEAIDCVGLFISGIQGGLAVDGTLAWHPRGESFPGAGSGFHLACAIGCRPFESAVPRSIFQPAQESTAIRSRSSTGRSTRTRSRPMVN